MSTECVLYRYFDHGKPAIHQHFHWAISPPFRWPKVVWLKSVTEATAAGWKRQVGGRRNLPGGNGRGQGVATKDQHDPTATESHEKKKPTEFFSTRFFFLEHPQRWWIFDGIQRVIYIYIQCYTHHQKKKMLVQNPPFMLCRSPFYGPNGPNGPNRLSWSRATLPAVQTSPWGRPLHPEGWREIVSGCGVTILKGYRNVKGDTSLTQSFPTGDAL